MLNFLAHICKLGNFMCKRRFLNLSSRYLTTSTIKAKYIDEPDYLKYTKPQVPIYELLNIQLKSYDFTVLEHYAKHVHKIALNMNLDVVDAWATPHQAWKITNHEPGTKKVIREYALNSYERNIQIANLHAYSAPLFFEVIRSFLPMGVSICIHPHQPDHEEIRYIPDFELIALKNQLKELTLPPLEDKKDKKEVAPSPSDEDKKDNKELTPSDEGKKDKKNKR